MVWNAIEKIADTVGTVGGDFDYKVLFALADGFKVRRIQEGNPAVKWIFRRDGFVTEIECDAG